MKRAFAVAGLGFGDEGKGATVDYLTRKYDARLIVRYNGGPQTAHNVVTPEGAHHTFAQFGSGTLAHGAGEHRNVEATHHIVDVKTFLSRFMLVNPLTMDREETALRAHGITAYDWTYIDSMALVVTPYHRAMNRLWEHERSMNRSQVHGSCGMGIGECRKYFMDYGLDAIFVGDLRNEATLYAKLLKMRTRLATRVQLILARKDVPFDLEDNWAMLVERGNFPGFMENYLEWASRMDDRIVGSSKLERLLTGNDTVIFEGAQGVLLDEAHGTYPHNTWTDTTFNNADTLLREMRFDGEVTKIGCVRTYATRHGAGPFPTEDSSLRQTMKEEHNSDSGCAGKFRTGYFDAAAVNYALCACNDTPPVDYLAVSHFDALNDINEFKICTHYNHEGKPVYKGFPRPPSDKAWWNLVREMIERHTYTQVGLTAWGPTANDRMEHDGKSDGYRRRAVYPLPWVPRGIERPVGDGEPVRAGKA